MPHKIYEHYFENDYPGFAKVTPVEIVEKFPGLKKFFKAVNFHTNKTFCFRLPDEDNRYGETGRYRIYLFTENHKYTIDICKTEDGGTYVGAGYSNRYQDPMETWTRGNDLTDGKLEENESLLMDIFLDIVETECIGLDVSDYTWENTYGFNAKKYCNAEQFKDE